jgi:hypothetical protein
MLQEVSYYVAAAFPSFEILFRIPLHCTAKTAMENTKYTSSFEFTPADLAFKIGNMEDRLFGIFERVFDLITAIDGRLKVIEAVLTAPPASNTRRHS